jgi:DNA-binding CsgD family transcriptional regulator
VGLHGQVNHLLDRKTLTETQARHALERSTQDSRVRATVEVGRRDLMQKYSQHESSGRALQITPWERRALQLLATGHTTNDLAVALGFSTLEIDPLLTRLFAAMGAATRDEAVTAAHRRGLLA